MIIEHPDTLTDYHRLKQISRGSKQAIEDSAIESYHKAIDEGRGKKEAEEEYFKHFNNKLCASKETSGVS